MRKQHNFSPPYILGIDAGTEAVKAGLFDATGTRVAASAAAYATTFPRPGWAEQSPRAWRRSLVAAVRECVARAQIDTGKIDRGQISGICADATTCTLLPLRADGVALRDALLWMDVRAAEQAARIFATGHPALRYCASGLTAEWMPPKALWLKQAQPDLYAQTEVFCEYADWIAYQLTGRFTLNINTITQRWLYHRPSGGWPAGFFAAAGLEGIEAKLSQRIVQVGEVIGPLLPAVAAELGLPPGIPVAAGGGDAFIGLLGLGVTAPGEMGVVMGSSNVLSALSAQTVQIPGVFGSFPDALIPGLELVEAGQVSTGSILAWFRRNFARDLEAEAAARGLSPFQLLDQEAAHIPIGSDGLIVLDSFQGNRTPHVDAYAKGAIWGLSLQSSRGHVFRALMEGIAYGLADILETLARHEFAVSRIIVAGGPTRSPLFMQIYADVLGQALHVTAEAEASLLGSAVAAAVGAQIYPSLAAAAQAMVATTGVYRPQPAHHAEYAFYRRSYGETYKQLKELMQTMGQHLAQGNAQLRQGAAPYPPGAST
jgi:ribulokinase